MRWIALHLVAILSSPALCQASDVPAIPEYISISERTALKAWLAANPVYRVAMDIDCNCKKDIETIRKGSGGVWKANPNYHPYYVAGDFNDDNENDFAVILIKTNEGGKHYLAIFNGPHKAGAKPVYLRPEEGALFFGAPRPKPFRLILGEFHSEGVSFVPKGATYEYGWE